MMADPFYGIIGSSASMLRLFKVIGKLAEDERSTVLIQGESGTGKERVARAIHALSPRNTHHFVPVHCAAIPDDFWESELFDSSQGVFIAAVAPKTGWIEYADGGTLFLDEIGSMTPVSQEKLLRVLQERKVEPVGSLQRIPMDVRIIAATGCDLEQMVAEGRFREDLYYRLSIIPVSIPPLRERSKDIPLLIDYFIRSISEDKTNPLLEFDRRAMQTLARFPWRGNVRELENLVRHMAIIHGGTQVGYNDLPEKYRSCAPTLPPEHVASPQKRDAITPSEQLRLFPPPPLTGEVWPENGIDFNALVNEFETRLIVQALKLTQGNKKKQRACSISSGPPFWKKSRKRLC